MKEQKKELIGGIQRFSTEDGPGIRTTVFFKGCPLRCKWCHNPELLDFGQTLVYRVQRCISCGHCLKACPQQALSVKDSVITIDRTLCRSCGICAEVCPTEALHIAGEHMSDEELLALLCKDKGFYNETGGGVTFSGGEVTSQPEYALRLLRKCREKNLKTALDTCGFCEYEKFLPLCREADTILFDIKCVDDDRHRQLTGTGSRLILENLRRLCEEAELRRKIIVRLPLIAGLNDSDEDVLAIVTLMKNLGLQRADGIPYHCLGVSKARAAGQTQTVFETPSDARMKEIAEKFRGEGIVFKIMGSDS